MYNIAIDGPAGSGKSTVAGLLARKLDILYLDTGAMYRACALKATMLGIDPSDEKAVSGFIGDVDITVGYMNGLQHTFLDGKDVSVEIRENDMSEKSSKISKHACVRAKMVDLQRQIAAKSSCVLDGRDICIHVLPDARYKFFLSASPEVRAERRYLELKSRGKDFSKERLLDEIKNRDYQDSHRANSPLEIAPDAIVIDTSDYTAEQVADYIGNIVINGEKEVNNRV